MKFLIKKPVVIVAAVIVFGALIARAATHTSTEAAYESVLAETRTVVAALDVTGRVEPAERVQLGFETAGKVAGVYASVGEMVRKGELLAALGGGELAADLEEAQANLSAEQAKLDELKRGSRPEEIRVYEVKAGNARVGRESAVAALANALADAFTTADDAIHNKMDQIFFNPTGQNPELRIPGIPFALKNELETERPFLESLFRAWRGATDIEVVQRNLGDVRRFLDSAALAVNDPTSTHQSAGVSETIPDAWRTSIAAARVNVNAAIGNLTAAEEKLRVATAALALAEEELALAQAGTTAEQIAAQSARVQSAEAAVTRAQSQLAKTVIRAPFDGIVVIEDISVGEIVSAQTPAISVMSATAFEIEAQVPEVDIAKLAVGNFAHATLDAYGADVTFDAVLSRIDPAETIVDGVTTYNVTLQFLEKDERIKSGMSANVRILTGTRDGVVAIPMHAVRREGGQDIVRVMRGELPADVIVRTGLFGSDGFVEILEGISAGDRVVTNN